MGLMANAPLLMSPQFMVDHFCAFQYAFFISFPCLMNDF